MGVEPNCYVIPESGIVRLGNVTTTVTKKDGTTSEILHKDILGIPRSTLHFSDTNIDFRVFTLQDAVDFAIYAIRTTIETIRFKSEPLTVAEPIDVLVITPDKAEWLQHKKLHV